MKKQTQLKPYKLVIDADDVNIGHYRMAIVSANHLLFLAVIVGLYITTSYFLQGSVNRFLLFFLTSMIVFELIMLVNQVKKAQLLMIESKKQNKSKHFLTITISPDYITSLAGVEGGQKLSINRKQLSRQVINNNYILITAKPELLRNKTIIFIPFTSDDNKKAVLAALKHAGWTEKRYSFRYYVYLFIIAAVFYLLGAMVNNLNREISKPIQQGNDDNESLQKLEQLQRDESNQQPLPVNE